MGNCICRRLFASGQVVVHGLTVIGAHALSACSSLVEANNGHIKEIKLVAESAGAVLKYGSVETCRDDALTSAFTCDLQTMCIFAV